MFKPGQSGNLAGGKKWMCCGRQAALKNLDAMLAEAGNAAKLRKAMQAEFDRNPMRFFKNIVMPLLPKESIRREAGLKVLWFAEAGSAFGMQPRHAPAPAWQTATEACRDSTLCRSERRRSQ